MEPKTRRHLQSWGALLIVTGIAVYLCWLMIQPFVGVILWAAVLAIISFPTYARWRKRGRGKSVAAGLTTAFVVAVIIVPLGLITLALVREAVPAAEALQSGMHQVLNKESPWVDRLGRWVDVDLLRDPAFISDKLKDAAGAVASRTAGILGGVVGTVVQVLFVLFTLYYLLRDADKVVPAVRAMLPLEDEQADRVFARTHEVISASLYGMVVIAAVQAVLGMIAFAVLGLRGWALWGVLMFVASFVPMIGTALVWVPAVIFLAATGHLIRAGLLVGWGLGVIGMVDNVLRPNLVGGRARLHELVIFFSVLGGLQVFGVLGLVIGPVVAAVTFSLLDVIRQASADPTAPPAAVPVKVVEPQMNTDEHGSEEEKPRSHEGAKTDAKEKPE